jgi:hypothetical protein
MKKTDGCALRFRVIDAYMVHDLMMSRRLNYNAHLRRFEPAELVGSSGK